VYFVIFFIENILRLPSEIMYYYIELERIVLLLHSFFERFFILGGPRGTRQNDPVSSSKISTPVALVIRSLRECNYNSTVLTVQAISHNTTCYP
jgi:hypothetical protein